MGGLISGAFKAVFGGGGGSKRIAEATLTSAEMTAASDREIARAATLAQQTQIAQRRAAEDADELLSKPQEKANVVLSAPQEAAEVDPFTKRRKTRRDQFFNSSNTGVQI